MLALTGGVLFTSCSSSGASGSAVPVNLLSQQGPFPREVPVATTSLAALRSKVGCRAAGGSCWPGVHPAPGKYLLVAIDAPICDIAPFTFDGVIEGRSTLGININTAGTLGPGACSSIYPVSDWLLAAPLAKLPRHEVLTVEIGGASATVRLP